MNPYDSMHDKLKDYRVTVDKNQLWAKTSHAIPKRKKKRGIILFFLSALAGAGLLWLGIHTVGQASSAKASLPTAPSRQELTAPQDKSSNEPAADAPSPKTQSGSSTPSGVQSNSAKTPHTTSDFDKANIPSASSSSSSIPTTQANASSSSIALTPANNESKSLNPLVKNHSTTSVSTSTTENEYVPEVIITMPAIVNLAVVDHQVSPVQPTTNASSTSNPGDLIVAEETTSGREVYLTSVLPMLPGYPKIPEVVHPEIKSPVATASRPQHHPFGVALTQAYGVSWFNMTTTDPALSHLTEAWETQLQSLENLNTTLHVTYRWPSGLQLNSGLAYNRLSTRMQISNSSEAVLIQQGITTVLIGEDGSIQNLYGDVEVHQFTERLATYYSYHHTLNVDLMVQIPLIRGYRMELNAWAKGAYTLYYASSGTTFDPNDGITSYNTDNNPFHLTSPFSFGLGIGGFYRMDPSWSLIGRMGYQPLTYTHGGFDDPIQFHHSILDLGLGIGFTF